MAMTYAQRPNDPTTQRPGLLPWFLRGGTLLLLLLAGWGMGTVLHRPRAEDWPARSGKIRVLTTILPLYDFAREVGGKYVEVRNLLPPGVDPHEFALSPRDIALVAGADVLIANGGGLDDFLTDAMQRARVTDKPVLEVSDGLPMLASAEHEEREGHGHETGDPHLWLNPKFARTYARRIAAAIVGELARRGEEKAAEAVRQRAARYDAELVRLDADYRRALEPLPNRSFIAFHGAFAYLAARYRLKVAAVWQTTPGREPAPHDIGAILRLAKAQHIRALFAEPQFSSRALEMIAADSGMKVYVLDPFETAPDLDAARYLDVMRRNLATLVRALGNNRE
jgi:zinc transport system substrate-binding protein